MVFQNPDAALNRAVTVGGILRRSLRRLSPGGDAGDAALLDLAGLVHLSPGDLELRPPELSGGTKQRVAIARSFAGSPRVVVCDEPVSDLDVSVQAAILNLVRDLREREGVSYLFISHDLGVVRYLSDRIAVLYLGRLMELGGAETVYSSPHHPYTEALLSTVPQEEGSERPRIKLRGEIPSHADPPSGCVFHTRCPRYIGNICKEEEPELKEVEPGHFWRCHYSVEDLRELQKTAPPEREDRASEGSAPEAGDEQRPTAEGDQRVLRVSNKPGPGTSEDKS
jgi:peptide/nickel transport system ATP-binding protein